MVPMVEQVPETGHLIASPAMEPDRPSFPEIYMSLARSLSARSTCAVSRVGTVITSVDFRKVLAVGYSGNATGLPNRCDREIPPPTAECPAPPSQTFDCGCLHSEENAVIHCDAPRTEPKIVFVTQMPCRACAKRIIQLGGLVDLYYLGVPHASDDAILADSVSRRAEGSTTVELITSVGARVHRLHTK
jgi:dCMP deaminase